MIHEYPHDYDIGMLETEFLQPREVEEVIRPRKKTSLGESLAESHA